MKSHRIRLKAVAASVAASLAVVGGLAGCGSSGGSSSGPATLEFDTNFTTQDPAYATLQSLAKQFHAKNPNTTINVKTGSTDYESDIKVRLASNTPPDLWVTHGWSLRRYSKFLAPLNNESWAKQVSPSLDGSMKNSSGQFFALPATEEVSGLIYNETVMQKSGVDPATIKTWPELQAAAAKVKAAGFVPFEMSGSKTGAAATVVDWLAPGAFSASELKALKGGTFQSASYQKLVGVLDTIRQKGWTNPDYSSASTDDVNKAFAQNKAGFYFGDTTMVAAVQQYNPKVKMAYVPVPTVSTAAKPYVIADEGLAIGAAAKGKHLAEAKKFLAFVAQPDNTAKLSADMSQPSGLVDSKSDLGALQASYDKWVKPAQVPTTPVFDRVYLPNGIWGTLVTTSDAVVTGTQTTAQATSQMAGDFKTRTQSGS